MIANLSLRLCPERYACNSHSHLRSNFLIKFPFLLRKFPRNLNDSSGVYKMHITRTTMVRHSWQYYITRPDIEWIGSLRSTVISLSHITTHSRSTPLNCNYCHSYGISCGKWESRIPIADAGQWCTHSSIIGCDMTAVNYCRPLSNSSPEYTDCTSLRFMIVTVRAA